TTRIEGADIRFEPAPDALKPFTGCFWTVTAECGATIRSVPDGTASVGVEVTPGRPAEWRLRGPLLRPAERRFAAPTLLVGVRLRPGVACLLAGIPAHAIVDRTIDLRDDPAWRALTSIDRVAEPAEYIDALRRCLIVRLGGATLHPIVTAALGHIGAKGGGVSVEEVAARCGVTARHLHRLMRRWVGYGPKRYASVVRFQSTLGQMQQAPAQPAAALASNVGYFDQAHLTAHLGRFAGATPRGLRSRVVSDFSKTRCDELP